VVKFGKWILVLEKGEGSSFVQKVDPIYETKRYIVRGDSLFSRVSVKDGSKKLL
jgi:hypothetical protein